MPEIKKSQTSEQKEASKDLLSGRETRDISPDIGEMRVDDNSKLIGYASKYGNFYDLGWFKERIKAGAFDDVLGDDVRCLKNHDPNYILGRTASGTLELESNSAGLKFTNDMPDTSVGRDTLEEVKRGDISGCSFSFVVAEDEWKYFEDDRLAERTITKIKKLFDVGPVAFPANPATSVVARDTEVARRSLDAAKKQEAEAESQEQEEQVADDKQESEVKEKKDAEFIKRAIDKGFVGKETPRSNVNDEIQDEPKEETQEETQEERKQRYHYEKGDRTAQRIINRCKSADV